MELFRKTSEVLSYRTYQKLRENECNLWQTHAPLAGIGATTFVSLKTLVRLRQEQPLTHDLLTGW